MATTITHAYTLYGVNFDPPGGTQVILNQIEGTPLNLGAVTGGVPNSGNLYPNCLFLSGLSPVISVTSGNIKAALAEIGVQGRAITSDADEYGALVYAQRLDKFGKRGSSGHRSARIITGYVVPRTLTATRDNATLTFDIIAIDDGADPLVIAESVALPAMSTTENHYVLDKVVIAGVTLGGQTEATIDFGVNTDIDRTGGKIFPNWLHVTTVTPTIVVNGFDVDWVRQLATDIDIEGAATTHANTLVYLKKRECGATFYADNTSNHIAFTMAGRVQPQSLLGGTGKLTSSLQITGNYDGTNAPLKISIDTTIA